MERAGNVMAYAREQELRDAELMRVRINLAKEAAIVDRFEWEAKSKKIEAICTPIMLVLASPFIVLLALFMLDMMIMMNPSCDNALLFTHYVASRITFVLCTSFPNSTLTWLLVSPCVPISNPTVHPTDPTLSPTPPVSQSMPLSEILASIHYPQSAAYEDPSSVEA